MKIPITFFAEAEREPLEVVHRQAGSFKETSVSRLLLNATLNYLFLLNKRRQIVMASENILELVPGIAMDRIIGRRPGEVLGCIHADECGGGCGTSPFCSQCGTVHAVLSGLRGCRAVEECHLTRISNGKMEVLHLQVLATPLLHDQQRYTLLTMANLGSETQ